MTAFQIRTAALLHGRGIPPDDDPKVWIIRREAIVPDISLRRHEPSLLSRLVQILLLAAAARPQAHCGDGWGEQDRRPDRQG